jgi:hypothetical protein
MHLEIIVSGFLHIKKLYNNHKYRKWFVLIGVHLNFTYKREVQEILQIYKKWEMVKYIIKHMVKYFTNKDIFIKY